MGGFLDALATLAGGFNDLEQIKKDGFDFRSKRIAEDQARQQQIIKDSQANQDWATKAGAEAALGAPEGTDLSTLIPATIGNERMRRDVAMRVGGAAAQSKSALAGQKAQTDVYLRQLANQGGLDVTRERGAQAEALARVRADIEAKRQPNPRDLALIQARGEVSKEVAGINQAGANARHEDSGGNGKWAWDTESNQSVWVTPQALAEAPPGKYADVTSGRRISDSQRAGGTATDLIQNTDAALTRYEDTMKGWGRMLPAALSPEKYVAWSSYLASLQSLAQLFGRTALQDQRVSDQDRAVYANAIGSTSQIVNILDPEEARRRLDLLKNAQNDYNQKYGVQRAPLVPGRPPAGGGVDPLEGRTATGPNGQKVVRKGGQWVPQ